MTDPTFDVRSWTFDVPPASSGTGFSTGRSAAALNAAGWALLTAEAW